MASAPTVASPNRLLVGFFIFEDFELLDVMGPAEFLGVPCTRPQFQIIMVSENGHPVRSRQGVTIVADASFQSCPSLDVLLVPGGFGTRPLMNDQNVMAWLQSFHAGSVKPLKYLLSVCTGSALLAKAGVIDGKQATTNRQAFDWVASQSSKVEWKRDQRWVVDGNVITSAGVSAGMDMILQFIAIVMGEPAAKEAATYAEYSGNWQDPQDI